MVVKHQQPKKSKSSSCFSLKCPPHPYTLFPCCLHSTTSGSASRSCLGLRDKPMSSIRMEKAISGFVPGKCWLMRALAPTMKTQVLSMKNIVQVPHQCSDGLHVLCEQSLKNVCEHENHSSEGGEQCPKSLYHLLALFYFRRATPLSP